jgi:hypothetical protein
VQFREIFLSFPKLNGQFGKLTDRIERIPVPELAEGALPKPYIYTVAYASGSERCVLIPSLILLLVLISVKFRVNPWQMLLLGFPLFLPSVASASASAVCCFRVRLWLLFFLLPT